MSDAPTVTPLSPDDEKTWSSLIHVGGLFFSVLPALVGYLVLRNRGPFIRSHTATALNFQLSMAIYAFVGTVVSVPLMIIGIGFLTIWLIPSTVWVLITVFSIIAAVQASRGQFYSYPLAIPFVR